MSKLMRTVIGIGILELVLGLLWFHLAGDMGAPGDNSPESQRALGAMIGGAMAAVLAFAILLSFPRWMKERQSREN